MSEKLHFEEDDVVRSGKGTGSSFFDVVERRLNRREFLQAGMLSYGLVATGALTNLTRVDSQPATGASPTGLDFTPIKPSTSDDIVLANNYEYHRVISWGDPIHEGVALFQASRLTAEAQAKSFGYNNDFVGYLPLPFGSNSSSHGLLCTNHEYPNPELMFPIEKPTSVSRAQAEVCLESMGFSIVEIQKQKGKWTPNLKSKLNRRITATTPCRIAGPAAGLDRLQTKRHPTGVTSTGTMSNCSAGKTPWGTVLSAEENFQSMFGNSATLTDPQAKASAARYGLSDKKSEYQWEQYFEFFDCSKDPNEPNTFGWVVEIDPYEPDSVPIKRTSLGRFRHEAATTHVTKSGKVVMYSGDDSRFEYVYKFVTKDSYNPKDRKANLNLLDEGTLYVAKFNDDGTGNWLPLVFGQGPLTEQNGFRNQGDVLVDARIAADLLGATKMDRPEDIEVNPITEMVYIVCTNNIDRGTPGKSSPDKANPRSENKHGHIIELEEAENDHSSLVFKWAMFMVCGEPGDSATFHGYPKDQLSPISCPDNICFDMNGNLWIATDGQEKALKLRDGFFAVPTFGPHRGKLMQLMASVVGSEVCGPEFTPDGKTAFLAIQHPGEGSTYDKPTTHWPDGKGVPRPSVIAIQTKNNDVIGSKGA